MSDSHCWSLWPHLSVLCSSCCLVGMSSGSSSCQSLNSCASLLEMPAPRKQSHSRPKPRVNEQLTPQRGIGPGPHAKESPLQKALRHVLLTHCDCSSALDTQLCHQPSSSTEHFTLTRQISWFKGKSHYCPFLMFTNLQSCVYCAVSLGAPLILLQ